MKQCRHCGAAKPVADFYNDKAARDGLRPECKACTAARRKAWYAANRDREIARVKQWQQENRERVNGNQRRLRESPERKRRERSSYLQRKHGITIEEYDEMLAAQGGGCAICARPPRPDISLHVDHDHATGRLRGILGWPCNNLLGDVHDDMSLLLAAAEYLWEHQAQPVA